MTVQQMYEALADFVSRGYGDRIVTQQVILGQIGGETTEVTGMFAGDDDDELVLETVEWTTRPPTGEGR
jgi:hypothetical protein